MTEVNVFDARNELTTKMGNIKLRTKSSVTEANCTSLLEEFHTSCPADSCTDPNSESFQLSVDQVCAAVNTRTKIKVETLGEFYDFRRWTVNVGNVNEKTPLNELRPVRCCRDDETDEEDLWYKSVIPTNPYQCPYAMGDKWTGDRDIRTLDDVNVTIYETESTDFGYDEVSVETIISHSIFDPNSCFTSNNSCSVMIV